MQAAAAKRPRNSASFRAENAQNATKTANSGIATGLYYYGARYLDPRTSRWISADPAMYEGDYIPSAPINDEAKKRNQNLPGLGGVFNYVNFHVYHYAGNNPVKLVDPDGRFFGPYYYKIETSDENTLNQENLLKMIQHIRPTDKIEFVEFMSKHGSTIALICYASGNVTLGLIIDGITLASDITMAYREYEKTGDLNKLSMDVSSVLFKLALSQVAGHMMGNGVKLAEKEFAEKLIPFTTTAAGITISEMQKMLNGMDATSVPGYSNMVSPFMKSLTQPSHYKPQNFGIMCQQ